jgi:hypothetical protein
VAFWCKEATRETGDMRTNARWKPVESLSDSWDYTDFEEEVDGLIRRRSYKVRDDFYTSSEVIVPDSRWAEDFSEMDWEEIPSFPPLESGLVPLEGESQNTDEVDKVDYLIERVENLARKIEVVPESGDPPSLSGPIDDLSRKLDFLMGEIEALKKAQAMAISPSSTTPPGTTGTTKRKRSRKPKGGKPKASGTVETQKSEASPNQASGSQSTPKPSKRPGSTPIVRQIGGSPTKPTRQSSRVLSSTRPDIMALSRLVQMLSREQSNRYSAVIRGPIHQQLSLLMTSEAIVALNSSIAASILSSGIASNVTQIQESLSGLLSRIRELPSSGLDLPLLRQFVNEFDGCCLSIVEGESLSRLAPVRVKIGRTISRNC